MCVGPFSPSQEEFQEQLEGTQESLSSMLRVSRPTKDHSKAAPMLIPPSPSATGVFGLRVSANPVTVSDLKNPLSLKGTK